MFKFSSRLSSRSRFATFDFNERQAKICISFVRLLHNNNNNNTGNNYKNYQQLVQQQQEEKQQHGISCESLKLMHK